MSNERSDPLEVKVSAAVKVVEHLIAICRGFESEEWIEKFLAVREALVSGRFKDAVREEAKLTCYTIKSKWVGSRYMERRLEEVMGVLHRHISYPNHSEPAVHIADLPKDVTVDREAEISAERAEIEARRIELATVGYLSITGGLFAGQLVALRAGQTLIGWDDTCQIRIEDPAISRIHASIVENDGRFFVKAHSNHNPAYLNDTRISSEETELNDRDRIRIDDHTFQYFLRIANPREASVTPTKLRPQNIRNAWKLVSETAHATSSLDLLLGDISLRGLELVMAEERWPGAPPRGWKIDAVELGHLTAICANPDDTRTWHAYAEWLDECDDNRGEFLRELLMLGSLSNADDRFEPLRHRCIDLWTHVDFEWGTAMLGLRKSRILNCAAATSTEPQVRFAFECPNQWDSLKLGGDPDVRYCKDCLKSVYFCTTPAEAEAHGVAGDCIAVSSRLALSVATIAEEAHQLMRPGRMTLGLPIIKMPYPLEPCPETGPYRTWGEVLFGDGT